MTAVLCAVSVAAAAFPCGASSHMYAFVSSTYRHSLGAIEAGGGVLSNACKWISYQLAVCLQHFAEQCMYVSVWAAANAPYVWHERLCQLYIKAIHHGIACIPCCCGLQLSHQTVTVCMCAYLLRPTLSFSALFFIDACNVRCEFDACLMLCMICMWFYHPGSS